MSQHLRISFSLKDFAFGVHKAVLINSMEICTTVYSAFSSEAASAAGSAVLDEKTLKAPLVSGCNLRRREDLQMLLVEVQHTLWTGFVNDR